MSKETGAFANVLRVLLGIFLTYAGLSHFFWSRVEFQAQVPTWVPLDADFVVLASGAVEIALGLSLIFLTRYKIQVGWITAIFFVLIFPGNINQYINEIDAFGLDSDSARLVRLFFQPLLIFWALASTGAWRKVKKEKSLHKNFYDFSAKDITGKDISMSRYQGKVVLVVNTASKCGLTPQYEGLEDLYKKYKEQGLVILGFPCNQFLKQEPGDEKSISQNCLINYGVSFPMFSKVKVNGQSTHPLFKYLKKELGGVFCDGIKWNFTKFLIDKDGKPMSRYAPSTKPDKLKKDIERLLKSTNS